jgi:hypothetical protein
VDEVENFTQITAENGHIGALKGIGADDALNATGRCGVGAAGWFPAAIGLPGISHILEERRMEFRYSPEVLALEHWSPEDLRAKCATEADQELFGQLCLEVWTSVAQRYTGQIPVSPGDLYVGLPHLLQTYRGDGSLIRFLERVMDREAGKQQTPLGQRPRRAPKGNTPSAMQMWPDSRPKTNRNPTDVNAIADPHADVEKEAFDRMFPALFDSESPLMRVPIRPDHADFDRLSRALFIARCLWGLSLEQIASIFHISKEQAQAMIESFVKRLRRRNNPKGE